MWAKIFCVHSLHNKTVMKITGDKHWSYQAIIDVHGVKQIYTMPTEKKFHGFLEVTKQ